MITIAEIIFIFIYIRNVFTKPKLLTYMQLITDLHVITGDTYRQLYKLYNYKN